MPKPRKPKDDQPRYGVAKIFMNGRSQAVRLPKEFRLEGTEVRVRRTVSGIILEDRPFDIGAWFARIDSHGDTGFMEDGRDQPPMPEDDPAKLFD